MGEDDSHIGSEKASTYDGNCSGNADEGYDVGGDYPANQSCNQFVESSEQTYDGGCAGHTDEGFGAGGDYPENQSCHQWVDSSSDATFDGGCAASYDWNQSCSQGERLDGTYDGHCAGGEDEDYGVGGDYSENQRCNQFVISGKWRHSIYVRTHTVHTQNYKHTITTHTDRHTVRTKPYLPYTEDLPDDGHYDFSYNSYVSISGRVYDLTDARGYSSATVATCNGSVGNATTDAKGSFGFDILRNSAFCLRDPGYKYDTSPNDAINTHNAIDGPDINQDHAPGRNPLSQAWLLGNTYEGQLATANAGDYNFDYTRPDVQIRQSVDAGTNDVKPGQTLKYTVTAGNIKSKTYNYRFEDFIPQNIDPDTVKIVSAQYNGHDVGASIVDGEQAPYDCGACIAPDSPKRVMVDLSEFEGADSLQVVWTGKVRDADHIGSYPNQYGYCANPSNWSIRGDNGNHNDDYLGPQGGRNGSSCENYYSGLQAVTNYARESYHWSSGYTPGFSGWGILSDASTADNRGGNHTTANINPIPGGIRCIEKTTDAEQSVNSIQMPGCLENYGFNYVFSTDGSVAGGLKYHTAGFRIQLLPDLTAGPVEYSVADKSIDVTGASNAAAMEPPIRLAAPDDGNASPQKNHTYANNILSWGNEVSIPQRWPQSSDPNVDTPNNFTYTYTATFDRPSGYNGTTPIYPPTFNNWATACYYQYWLDNHPATCVRSNVLHFTSVGVTRPFFTTAEGGVHVGGGPQGACSQGAPAPSGSNFQLRDNVGGQGWFVVSSAGSIDSGPNVGFDSISGSARQNYTMVCRPDLATDALNLLHRPAPNQYQGPSMTSYAGGGSSSAPDPDSHNDGRIVALPSGSHTFTLGSDSQASYISKRWTLYVDGDLYIANNVNYHDQQQGLSNLASLGVIVTGNIYIDPRVTHLDGAYYAHGLINTCATSYTNTVRYVDSQNTVHGGISPAQCKSRLQVNGLFMAHEYRFNRGYTTDPDGTIHPAETISMGDTGNRLFLATPPAFSTLALQFNPAQYGGERRPRY